MKKICLFIVSLLILIILAACGEEKNIDIIETPKIEETIYANLPPFEERTAILNTICKDYYRNGIFDEIQTGITVYGAELVDVVLTKDKEDEIYYLNISTHEPYKFTREMIDKAVEEAKLSSDSTAFLGKFEISTIPDKDKYEDAINYMAFYGAIRGDYYDYFFVKNNYLDDYNIPVFITDPDNPEKCFRLLKVFDEDEYYMLRVLYDYPRGLFSIQDNTNTKKYKIKLLGDDKLGFHIFGPEIVEIISDDTEDKYSETTVKDFYENELDNSKEVKIDCFRIRVVDDVIVFDS